MNIHLRHTLAAAIFTYTGILSLRVLALSRLYHTIILFPSFCLPVSLLLALFNSSLYKRQSLDRSVAISTVKILGVL